MARRGGFSATFNGVRYLLLALGVLILVGTKSDALSDVRAFAWMCILIGFPYSLALWLLLLPFRFVAWLLRLFGIVKRNPKAAPVSKMRVTVEVRGVQDVSEWGDDPATDKQLGFIRHLGGNPPDDLTKSQASELIDALMLQKDVDRIKAARRKARSE